MNNFKISNISLGDVKTRVQKEAERLTATGEYMTANDIARKYSIGTPTVRQKMQRPDRSLGTGQKVFLYKRERVDSIFGQNKAI